MPLPKAIMITGALLILGLFIFPLWNITLEAPQYPIPLRMDIHINKFTDYHPNDMKNINLMNHYVGMKPIPETMKEFTIFPIVTLVMSIIGILIGWFNKGYKWFLAWFIAMVLLASSAIIDFYLWEYDYGHDLNPNAIMKFKDDEGNLLSYQPPLIGSKRILNFTAHSYPSAGAYFLLTGIGLSFVAFVLTKNKRADL